MRTHCPYCALQCAMNIKKSDNGALAVVGDAAFNVNAGDLCMKGFSAAATLAHPERLLEPLIRKNGRLVPGSWDEALHVAAAGFCEVAQRHGPDANSTYGSGSLTNEKAYALGKFARVVLGTANFDYNGRYCMSSAAAAANRSLGIDRGLPFPLSWLGEADVILLAGGNPFETMPPLERYFTRQRARGQSIVIDPRATAFASKATLHLQVTPGTDAILAHSILHVLIVERWIDGAYIARRTRGFNDLRRLAEREDPERAEIRTGVPADHIRTAARVLAEGKRVLILTSRGIEQHRNGTDATNAFINLALALGLPGKEGCGYGTLTGQGNGQGGREHGQKSDQLPGYCTVDDDEAVARVARVWKVPQERIRRRGKTAAELLDLLGTQIHGLFVMGSNPVVSAPRTAALRTKIAQMEHIVVCDFFLSETAEYAHVVLPTLQWAEETGTITNLEGRVLLRERCVAPPPGPRSDLEILRDLADRMSVPEFFPSADAQDVFNELRAASAGGRADYSGVTYERLRAGEKLYWPVPGPDHPGTPVLFTQRFPTRDGRARFIVAAPQAVGERVDQEYPWTFTTGRVREQYLSGTQTRRVRVLARAQAEPVAEIHPQLAARYGIRDNAFVRISSRRGSVEVR
ncbi:MAG TPA: molybdopterin oxidoreductase family protein, partial [Candidatus Acidoferrales bacterium]|nr:molybdopterin oxidoreductase family protein [Candidatus Acidoferrales bacterium]